MVSSSFGSYFGLDLRTGFVEQYLYCMAKIVGWNQIDLLNGIVDYPAWKIALRDIVVP